MMELFPNYKLFFEEEIQDYVRSAHSLTSEQTKSLIVVHGTTLVALKYKDGVVMGADMRATASDGSGPSDTMLDTFEKIFRIDAQTLMSIAGNAAFGLHAVKFLEFEIYHWEKNEEEKMTFEGKANVLSQIVSQLMPLVIHGMGITPILANREKIYFFDPMGGQYSVDHFSTGSGGKFAKGTIKKWKPNLSREDAVELAIVALKEAEDNQQTGPNKSIYTISKKIDKVSQAEIDTYTKGGAK